MESPSVDCKTSELIYLASPYTHPDVVTMLTRVNLVAKAAGFLMREGKHVYCPVVHGHHITGHGEIPYNFWIASGLDMLRRSDALWVLCITGWNESLGVKTEIGHARQLDKPVTFCRLHFNSVKSYEPTQNELQRL